MAWTNLSYRPMIRLYKLFTAYLIHFILATKSAMTCTASSFKRSDGSAVQACSPQMSSSARLGHFACDLLACCVSEAICFFHLQRPRFSAEEPRYTEPADAAVFQMAEGDVCALTLRHTQTCLSAHTDRAGRGRW